MSDLAVETTGLTKDFAGRRAVAELSMLIPRGSVYGFLGPNGSGKTTTIRMLLGLIRPTGGEVRVLGHPIATHAAEVLPRVGSLVEGPAFHPYLSGRDNLRRLDAADRTVERRTTSARIDTALERVGLTHAAGKRFRAYSLGMKQRLAIAAALLTPRELMVLDEPTNGLDPQGTREVRGLVAALAAEGTTVLLSSHLLSEIEQVCTHLGIMNTGAMVAQGTLGELRSLQVATFRVSTDAPDRAAATLTRLGLVDVRRQRVAGTDGVTARPDPARPAPRGSDLVAALVADGVPVEGFTRSSASLEDLFVELTGEGFDVAG